MGGTSSKNGLVKFNDDPEDYKTQTNLFYKPWYSNLDTWQVDLYREQDEISQKVVTRIIIQRHRNYHHQIEFTYQFRFVHKYRLKRPFVKRGIGTIYGDKQFNFIGFEGPLSTNYLVNFQASVYALIDEQGIRIFNFIEPNLYGKSRRFGGIQVPVEYLSRRAPLLAAQIETGKNVGDFLFHVCVLLQLVYGVHIQIEAKRIEPILELAVEYKLDYVRRYCEQQIIRRLDLKFTKLQKYEMACKYDLGLLMSQILVGMKSRRKLKNFAIKTIGIDKMNGKIMKLIAGKIFEFA